MTDEGRADSRATPSRAWACSITRERQIFRRFSDNGRS
jgi:hypothetical protein